MDFSDARMMIALREEGRHSDAVLWCNMRTEAR
jgi:hypothetical protein